MTSNRATPPITPEEYEAALVRVGKIFHAEPGTRDGDILNELCDLISAYEDKHFPIAEPTPEDAAQFRRGQENS